MVNTGVSIALLLALSVCSVQGLSCAVCRPELCKSTESIKQQCKGGLVYDECYCCKTCAKVEGEVCGGLWNFDGKCDQGLVCDNNDDDDYEREYWSKGRCRRQQTITTTPMPSNKVIKFPTRWEKVFKTTEKTEQSTIDSSGDEIDEKEDFESSGLGAESWTWLKTEPTTETKSDETRLPTTEPSEEIIIF